MVLISIKIVCKQGKYHILVMFFKIITRDVKHYVINENCKLNKWKNTYLDEI